MARAVCSSVPLSGAAPFLRTCQNQHSSIFFISNGAKKLPQEASTYGDFDAAFAALDTLIFWTRRGRDLGVDARPWRSRDLKVDCRPGRDWDYRAPPRRGGGQGGHSGAVARDVGGQEKCAAPVTIEHSIISSNPTARGGRSARRVWIRLQAPYDARTDRRTQHRTAPHGAVRRRTAP
jgi:hypothetical protein